ncbi:MAG: nucleotide sugar dehydrogenase [Oceanipulchritudo sp.]
MKKVAVMGQGYVGLPLSLLFAESGWTVRALDIDSEKIRILENGESYIRHIAPDRIRGSLEAGTLLPDTDFSRVAECDAVLICVPTPLDAHRQPDMSYVSRTARAIGPHLPKGCLVVLESTAYPGATDELMKCDLEETSGLRAGEDFHLAFSPEREDPGNPQSQVKKIPKLVGGFTPACLEKAVALYRSVIDTVVPVSSCRVAEAAKLTENIFRSVNIALVNELKVIYEHMDIDVWEVIEAAKTKPFGFMPFYPGPGLGGHCIPIDPFYLSWRAKEKGLSTRFIELAGEINTFMPDYVLSRLMDGLNASGKPLRDSKVLVVGMAYKKGVDDMRESPALRILDRIQSKGGRPYYYDPYIPVLPVTREYIQWKGMKSISWDKVSLNQFDAAVIVTAHDDVPYADLVETVPVIIDTRNAMDGIDAKPGQIWKS